MDKSCFFFQKRIVAVGNFESSLLLLKFPEFIPLGVFRSSRSQMFFKIEVLKNFAIFTVKHLCWSFLMKLKRDFKTGIFL